MCRFSMTFAVVVGVILLTRVSAPAGTIPYSEMSIYDVSSQLDTIGRSAVHTIDNSGMTGGGASDAVAGVNWESHGVGMGYGADDPLPASITFDLGANYNLASTHVWNYNCGEDFSYC